MLASDPFLRRLLEALPIGVMLVDAQGLVDFVNPRAEADTGYGGDELHGEAIEILAPRSPRSGWPEVVRRCISRQEGCRIGGEREAYVRRKNGSLMLVEIGLTPFQASGLAGALATFVDLSQSKAIERREIIACEVRHRARNILTLVQAVARLTLPAHESASFLDMLQAIVRTQDVLYAQGAVPLRTILEGELSQFPHQIDDADCELELSAHAAQDFGLIVHELTTNALKYGALSAPGGRVEVSCRRETDGRSFSFIWREVDGPKITPPAGRGFGGRILTDIARGFAAHVEMDYAPDGFRYELRAELARICDAAGTVESRPSDMALDVPT
jgi:PAS domain S-box-containing protein